MKSTLPTALFTAALLLLLPLSAEAAKKKCKCNKDQKLRANARLTLTEAEQAAAIAQHLPWGYPTSPANTAHEHRLIQQYYIIHYDDDLRTPIWTAYHLEEDIVDNKLSRCDCFRADPRLIKAVRSTTTDYTEPIYDRGHMAPSAAFKADSLAMFNTYMMSNMAPQHDNFNRDIWRFFEEYVRDWTKEYGQVWVITGAVFDHDGNGQRDGDNTVPRMESKNGKQRVGVATHFYKILTRKDEDGNPEIMAILLPHDDIEEKKADAPAYLEQHIVPVDDIEAVTGIDFFPSLEVEESKKAVWWPVE
jgi:endonuclease G